MRLLLTIVLAVLMTASQALACAFHGFTAPVSVVDRLLESDRIVLARPDPDDPFRFTVVETLAGPPDSQPIGHLVDSATRRLTAADSGAKVLFARAGFFSEWRRIGTVPARHRALIGEVVSRLPGWRRGEDAGRAALLAPYVTDENALVRRMSVQELDRLSWDDLAALDPAPDAAALLARLDVMQEYYMKPVRILLLGFADDPRARARVLAGLEPALKDGRLLGAYATAYIQMEGQAGVETLAERFLTGPGYSVIREAVLRAMVLHAQTGTAEVRAAIRRHMAAALAATPELVPVRGARRG